VIAAFRSLGFEAVREGNHISSMRRRRPEGGSEFLTIPNHTTIRASTLRTVLTQAGITREDSLHACEQA
jgi:hypothetical protein